MFIETVQMLPMGMLNGFLLIQGADAMLIDSGLPGSETHVWRMLKKHNLDWQNIRAIVLTHGHIDHAGSAKRIRELTTAPIIAHAAEVPYLLGAKPLLRPTGSFGRLFQMTGAIQRPFEYFAPDLPIYDTRLGLEDFGFAAEILHTPGHTPGSVSVLLEDGQVFGGDLIASGILLGGIVLKNRPKQPPFEEDHLQVASSLNALLAMGCTRFHVGHGGPLNAAHVRSHIHYLEGLN